MSMIYIHVYVYDIHIMYIRNMNAITINKKDVMNLKVINEGSMGGFGKEMEGK